MSTFRGFTDAESFTQFPNTFFQQLLPKITGTDELKVTLYAIWRIEHIEGPVRALREADFDAKDLGLTQARVRSGITRAVRRGCLLRSVHDKDTYFFLNSARGRAAAEAFANGHVRDIPKAISASPVERSDIFKLYEENIGPLTPLIADMLKEAEGLYRAEWVEEAFVIAAKSNVRNWKYVEAILKRWKENGHAQKQNKRDDKKSRQRNLEDKIKKFVDG
jgi:DNA replication protein